MSDINIGTGNAIKDAIGWGNVTATTTREQITLDPSTHKPNTPPEDLRTVPINIKGQDGPVFISPKQLAEIKAALKDDPNAFPDIKSLPGQRLLRQQ